MKSCGTAILSQSGNTACSGRFNTAARESARHYAKKYPAACCAGVLLAMILYGVISIAAEKVDFPDAVTDKNVMKNQKEVKESEREMHAPESSKQEQDIQADAVKPDVQTGFDKYPKRSYPLLFNNVLYNLLYSPTRITKIATIPGSTASSVISLESGYSMIERLSNYPVNLLYDKIGTGWTTLIMLTKMAAVDFPFAYFLKVLNHEYSGHAMRFLESGQYIDRIDIGVPLWWGHGGGATSGTIPSSVDQNIFITAAGSEANTVMAYEMDIRFMSTGVIYPFDMLLFVNAKFDQLLYLNRSTGHSSGLRMMADGDYEEYLILMNNKYGRVLPHTYRLTLNELKRWSYVALADPFLYFAGAALFYNLITGKRYMATPMIPLGTEAWFMPSARVAYTPNGPECYGDLFFKLRSGPVLLAYVRAGSRSLRETWGGGVRLFNISTGRFVELGGGLDLFSQPRVMNYMSTALIETVFWNQIPTVNPIEHFGLLTALDLTYGFIARGIKRIIGCSAYADVTFRANESFRAYLRIGYKSNGYVFGMKLNKGLFWHAGMGFNF